MSPPTEIRFRGMTPSPAVEEAIHRWVDHLAQVSNRITRCDVILEVPHRHHQRGRTFHARIELAVPGRIIVAARDPGHPAHENAFVAVADAFRAAKRQLLDFIRIKEAA